MRRVIIKPVSDIRGIIIIKKVIDMIRQGYHHIGMTLKQLIYDQISIGTASSPGGGVKLNKYHSLRGIGGEAQSEYHTQ